MADKAPVAPPSGWSGIWQVARRGLQDTADAVRRAAAPTAPAGDGEVFIGSVEHLPARAAILSSGASTALDGVRSSVTGVTSKVVSAWHDASPQAKVGVVLAGVLNPLAGVAAVSFLTATHSNKTAATQGPQATAPVAASGTPAMGRVHVLEGDIARLPADALLTPLDPHSTWTGGVDQVIHREAGNMYHGQVDRSSLVDGKAVVARKQGETTGSFRDVVFVGDTTDKPLSDIVYGALKAADAEGYKKVSLGAWRTGAKSWSTPQDVAVQQMAEGIKRAKEAGLQSITDIGLVVYQNHALAEAYRAALQQAGVDH